LHIADIVEVYDRLGGADAAIKVARERRGKMFDPSLVDCFADNAEAILPREETSWADVIAADPALGVPLTDAEIDDTLATFGDFVDIKSPNFVGHSRRVADLASEAAERCGLRAEAVTEVRRAGWVHDLGVMGVSNSIWDYAGPLNTSDRERMQTHPYLADRTLSRVPALAPVARLVAQHHERADGSGYPSGLRGEAIAPGARILGAADAYTAWRETRPYRSALTDAEAAARLRDECGAGRFDAEATDAVLRAVGHRPRTKAAGPAGLTARELEVLICVARGQKNKEIAATLNISAKTVSAHLERIYVKTNVTSRAGATLFAMRSGLLD
jgi:HD-GYP domain-containing protein (c-di-GMP phosphodiesterase class II)